MKSCIVNECKGKHLALGYCGKHYQRYKKYGDPNKTNLIVTRHGLHGHPIYGIWKNMNGRCYNKNAPNHCDYGGRGIRVCDRWRHSFKNFLDDMGDRPTTNHSIDRIDNDGNYSPENCKWSTRFEQNHNQRVRKNNKTGHKGIYRKNGYYEIYGTSYGTANKPYVGSARTVSEAVSKRDEFEKTRRLIESVVV